MGKFKHLVILCLVVLVAVFLAAPSAFAKKALTENELEMISAAGEPVGIWSEDGSITYSDQTLSTLTLDGVQSGLNALTLNNVAGENNLATGLNIQAAHGSDNAAAQSNDITQSWGSTFDWSYATAAGKDAGNGCGSTVAASSVAVCINSPGGASTADQIVRLSAYADVLLKAEYDVNYTVDPQATLTLANGAQDALVALVVNNVVGMNQVASGINIMSGDIGFAPALSLAGAGAQNVGAGQSNTINQFRGSPYGFATR